MRRRSLVIVAALVVVLAVVWSLTHPPALNSGVRAQPAVAPEAARPRLAPKMASLAAEIGPDSISPIANDLDAPGGTARHDVEILNAVFEAWRTNFPHDGNPVGENYEITAALAGANRLHYAFIAPNHRAINDRGEICDRWGTPFWFHQLSGTQMEIRSAGPDKKFGTGDDVEFAPWPKEQ